MYVMCREVMTPPPLQYSPELLKSIHKKDKGVNVDTTYNSNNIENFWPLLSEIHGV